MERDTRIEQEDDAPRNACVGQISCSSGKGCHNHTDINNERLVMMNVCGDYSPTIRETIMPINPMMNDTEYAVIVEALPVNGWMPEELDGELPVATAALAAGAGDTG